MKPCPSTSQTVMRLAKLSAAKAEPRKPARVMPIWMVERNLVGNWTIPSRRAAVLSPSSACAGAPLH